MCISLLKLYVSSHFFFVSIITFCPYHSSHNSSFISLFYSSFLAFLVSTIPTYVNPYLPFLSIILFFFPTPFLPSFPSFSLFSPFFLHQSLIHSFPHKSLIHYFIIIFVFRPHIGVISLFTPLLHFLSLFVVFLTSLFFLSFTSHSHPLPYRRQRYGLPCYVEKEEVREVEEGQRRSRLGWPQGDWKGPQAAAPQGREGTYCLIRYSSLCVLFSFQCFHYLSCIFSYVSLYLIFYLIEYSSRYFSISPSFFFIIHQFFTAFSIFSTVWKFPGIFLWPLYCLP